jgi:hypothetical protein
MPVPAKIAWGQMGCSACIAAMGCYDWAPHPLDTHSTSVLYIFKVFYILYMWLVSIWMQLNTVIAWPTPTPNHSQQYHSTKCCCYSVPLHNNLNKALNSTTANPVRSHTTSTLTESPIATPTASQSKLPATSTP